ncbi:MAG: hypothetical protein KJ674_01835 [Nanoarchaeota archaeon]|nr:hypothetical protein [Nanoarchaeota archaeon]
MEIKAKITQDNTKESAKKFGALKNEKHIKLLLFIEKNPNLSMDDIHNFSKNNKLFLNRQSTHKALEKLTKTGFLNKIYDEKQNKIVYRLKI